MPAPCKIFKYKKRKSIRPRKPQKSCSDSVTVTGSDFQPLFYPEGKGEYDESFESINKEVVTSPLERIREWVQKQRFIPQNLAAEFLLLFLAAESYQVDAAIDKLRKYFSARQEPSVLYRDRDPLSAENVEIFKKLYVLPMSTTTYDGCRVILTGLFGPTCYNQMEHAKALAMVLDLLIWENNFGYGDFVVILDGSHFQWPQMLENKVRNHRSITSLLMDTIPGTLRSFYLLHPPCYVKNVAANRNGIWFTVVKNTEALVKHIPRDILPEEYGGTQGNLKNLIEKWQHHMTQNRGFFVNFEKEMINDHRRRLCHEEEVAVGGINWIYNLRLEEEEWDYKIRYYLKMRDFRPLKHPAYGLLRLQNRKKPKKWKDPFARCRKQAAEELEGELKWCSSRQSSKKIRKEKSESDVESCVPILELYVHYFQ